MSFSSCAIIVPTGTSCGPSFLKCGGCKVLIARRLRKIALAYSSRLKEVISKGLFITSSIPRRKRLVTRCGKGMLRGGMMVRGSSVSFELSSIVLSGGVGCPVRVRTRSGGAVFPVRPDLLG